MSDESFVNPVPTLIDRANHRADHMLHSTEQAAQNALDSLMESAQGVKSEAAKLGQRGLDALHDGGLQLRESAHKAGERTRDYIRDEPVKAVLVAAATGAALMALVNLVAGRRHHD